MIVTGSILGCVLVMYLTLSYVVGCALYQRIGRAMIREQESEMQGEES